MCGRFTAMYTWEEKYNLYMLSVGFRPQTYSRATMSALSNARGWTAHPADLRKGRAVAQEDCYRERESH
jgi:hypothetical protein